MRNQFPGYYKPSEEEFDKLWKNCIFSFDTNILLNVYRYSPKTRERLFEIWHKLNGRIWLPHQVALEYLQERLNVISHQSKPYRELQDMLDDASKSFTQKIEEFSKRHSFSSHTDTKELLKILEDAHNQIKDKLNNSSASYPNLLESDNFWDKITQLFHEKVGEPYATEDASRNFKKAEHRFKQQQPPGYLDANKPEAERYGDVILWFQLIDYVKSEKKPLIFVTDDEKKDWWLKHKGKTVGPRPELIQEMLNDGGVEFYLYTGDRFLDYAAIFLGLEDEPEVAKEAEEVRHEQELGRKLALSQFMDSISESMASDEFIKAVSSINSLEKATTDRLSLKPETQAIFHAMKSHRTLMESDAWRNLAISLNAIASQSINELTQVGKTISPIADKVKDSFLDVATDSIKGTIEIENIEELE
jgi:hypothetical protein